MHATRNQLTDRALTAGLLAVVIALCAYVTPGYLAMRRPDALRKGPGVTRVAKLSEWFAGIQGSHGDTEVYILDSGQPGGSALLLGGTHGNEPAGYMAAILLLENAVPAQGKLYVIPHANASAMTYTDPMEGVPRRFTLQAASGPRTFRHGSRATSPMDQWPDPDIYVHASSGQQLSGAETRNLNRAYPGRADGNFTEKVAFAITSLVRKERIDLTIDLHEAAPEYPVINTIVAQERALATASGAILNLELEGIVMGLEPSPANLRGLSHRELGASTPTLALLMESPNATQGRLRGRTDEALLLTGKDPQYVKGQKLGRLFVPYDEKGWPLQVRVARHVAGLQAILAAHALNTPERSIVLSAVPTFDEVANKGLEPYL
jgi:hypothetical protein